MTSKLPICPDNYKLDSSTCMCISTISDKKTLPRCPNGYHRDNKTLECVDKITGKKLTQKQKKVTTKKQIVKQRLYRFNIREKILAIGLN